MSEGNLNITPEMISNLVNVIKNGNNSDKNASSSDDSKTNSNFFADNNNFSNDTSEQNFTNNIDLETIFKIKSIMESLNKKDDPRSNLLYSLKPYLRTSRQKKIDQYVNLFKIAQVSNLFKSEKGDET